MKGMTLFGTFLPNIATNSTEDYDSGVTTCIFPLFFSIKKKVIRIMKLEE